MDTLHVRVEMNDSDDSEASETSLESEVRRKKYIIYSNKLFIIKTCRSSVAVNKLPLNRQYELRKFAAPNSLVFFIS